MSLYTSLLSGRCVTQKKKKIFYSFNLFLFESVAMPPCRLTRYCAVIAQPPTHTSSKLTVTRSDDTKRHSTFHIYDLIIGLVFVTKSLTCNGTIAKKLTTELEWHINTNRQRNLVAIKLNEMYSRHSFYEMPYRCRWIHPLGERDLKLNYHSKMVKCHWCIVLWIEYRDQRRRTKKNYHRFTFDFFAQKQLTHFRNCGSVHPETATTTYFCSQCSNLAINKFHWAASIRLCGLFDWVNPILRSITCFTASRPAYTSFLFNIHSNLRRYGSKTPKIAKNSSRPNANKIGVGKCWAKKGILALKMIRKTGLNWS